MIRRRVRRERGGGNGLETLESLLEEASDDLLLHSTRPTVPHDIRGATLIHETHGNVQVVTVNPSAADTKNIWVFRDRHEGCLPLEKAEGAERKRLKIKDFESAWDWGGITA